MSEVQESINQCTSEISVVSESEESTNYIRCIGFQDQGASKAVDEMAVIKEGCRHKFS